MSHGKYPNYESNVLIGAANKSEVEYCKGYTLFVLYELYLTFLYLNPFTESLIECQ